MGRVKSNDLNANTVAAVNNVLGRKGFPTIDSFFRAQSRANHLQGRKAYRQVKTLNGPALMSTPAQFIICGDQISRIVFRLAYTLENDVVEDMQRDIRFCSDMLSYTGMNRIIIEVQYKIQSTKHANVIKYAMKLEGKHNWWIKLDHEEGYTSFSEDVTTYRYVLEDACRVVVYASLTNDERLY